MRDVAKLYVACRIYTTCVYYFLYTFATSAASSLYLENRSSPILHRSPAFISISAFFALPAAVDSKDLAVANPYATYRNRPPRSILSNRHPSLSILNRGVSMIQTARRNDNCRCRREFGNNTERKEDEMPTCFGIIISKGCKSTYATGKIPVIKVVQRNCCRT